MQRDDGVADRLAHPPHLALATLVQDDLDDALPAGGVQHAHAGRRRAAPVELDAARQAGAPSRTVTAPRTVAS